MKTRILCLFLILNGFLTAHSQRDPRAAALQLFKQAERAHNDYETYIDLAGKALPLLKQNQLWEEYLSTLAGLRSAAFFMSDYRQADAFAERMLIELDTIHVSREMIAKHLLLQVVYYYFNARNDRVEELCEKVLEMDRTSKLNPQTWNIGDAYNNLGIIYKAQGAVKEAISTYYKALECYSPPDVPGHEHLSTIKNNLGNIYLLLKDYPLSRKNYFESLVIQEKLPPNPINRRFLGDLYLNIAGYYLAVEIPDSAGLYIRKAGMINHMRPDYYAKLNLQRGQWKLAVADTTGAEVLFRNALERYYLFYRVRNPLISKTLTSIGELHLNTGHPAEALIWFQRAVFHQDLSAADSTDISFNPVAGAKAVALPFELVRLLWLKGRALEATGQQEAALGTYQAASDWIWHIRSGFQSVDSKLFLSQQAVDIFESGIDLAYRLYRDTGNPTWMEAAFRFSELSKAGLLLEAALEAEAKGLSIIPDSLFRMRTALMAEVAFYDNQLTNIKADSISIRLTKEKLDLELELTQLNRRLELEFPAYFTFKQQTNVQTIDQLQQWATSQKKAVAVYFWGKKRCYRFTVDDLGTGMKAIDIAPAISDQLRAAVTACSDPSAVPNDFRVPFLNLYTYLLGDFDAATPLIVIPDGQLNYLPFEVLLTGPPQDQRQSKWPYLLRRRNIAYAYSASLLLLNQPDTPGANTNLFMAPYFTNAGSGLAPLQFSTEELKNFPSEASVILEKGAATLANFQYYAGQSRWIHLSTHAHADGIPRIEFIDGPMYLTQLYAMSIPAEMVVLSACETNAGQLKSGEGVMSLARGFAYAGARSLVAGFWRVNEQSSARTLSRFYRYLQKGCTGPEALQKAKLAYLDDDDVPAFRMLPYYWAGMAYIGQDVQHEPKKNWVFWGIGAVLVLGMGITAVRKRL